MSLYVVAWPLLSEADETALCRLRAQYHPKEADLIGPHFTLVFGASDAQESQLRTVLAAIEGRAFWFMIDRIVRDGQFLFAEPSDGAEMLIELHDALNSDKGAIPFRPHITLGMFDRPLEAEQVARIVERQHLPMRGRIEELTLLRLQGDKLVPLLNLPLTA